GQVDFVGLAQGIVRHYEPMGADGKPIGTINAVLQDHSGKVWLGVNSLNLYRLDPQTGQVTNFPIKTSLKRPTPPKGVIALYEDQAGTLWVAVNQDGLYHFDLSGKQGEFYEAPAAPGPEMADLPPERIPHPPITNLVGDGAGHIWVSTLNGFSRFDPAAGSFEQYNPRAGMASGAGSYIEAVLQAHDGVVWIASRDGLIRLNDGGQSFTYFTEKDGLPSDYVVSLLADERGNLWLGTKRGLSRFTPSTET